jgi:hypothetical protein
MVNTNRHASAFGVPAEGAPKSERTLPIQDGVTVSRMTDLRCVTVSGVDSLTAGGKVLLRGRSGCKRYDQMSEQRDKQHEVTYPSHDATDIVCLDGFRTPTRNVHAELEVIYNVHQDWGGQPLQVRL